VATLLFIGFILFLHIPHLLFKFGLASAFELGSKTTASQIEEFFEAAMPSLLIDGIAYGILTLETHLVSFSLGLPLTLPGVHWPLLLQIVRSERPDLASHLSGVSWVWTFISLINLAFWSVISGRLYGVVEARWTIESAGEVYSPIRRRIELAYQAFWRVFYFEYLSPFYRHFLRNAYVFARTKERLFYGQLFSFDKSPSGEIDGIYLVDVRRCMLDREDEFLSKGRNPIRRLTGPLFIRWDEIIDVNFPEPGAFERTFAEYERILSETNHRERLP
jgi:hypothetical protein